VSKKHCTSPKAPSTSPASGQVSTKPPAAKENPSPAEILPAPLSKHELRPMIRKARRYARAFKRNGLLWAVELRLLQDAGAHQTYGRKSFGDWAAIEFADLDLSSDNANKLSQAGRVILALERHGRVDLTDPRTFPGPTGTRGLASVLAAHGEQAMLDIYDHCPPGHVVANTVNAAISALLPQPAITTTPEPTRDWEEDDEEPEEISKEVLELRSHVDRLHDYLHDISCADDADPIAVARTYEHFLQDAQELGPVLSTVLPDGRETTTSDTTPALSSPACLPALGRARCDTSSSA
jgi:hypothetical protein